MIKFMLHFLLSTHHSHLFGISSYTYLFFFFFWENWKLYIYAITVNYEVKIICIFGTISIYVYCCSVVWFWINCSCWVMIIIFWTIFWIHGSVLISFHWILLIYKPSMTCDDIPDQWSWLILIFFLLPFFNYVHCSFWVFSRIWLNKLDCCCSSKWVQRDLTRVSAAL